MMRTLTPVEIDDILVGCAIRGTGGGGSLAGARETMRRDLAAGRVMRLVDLEDLDDDVWTASPYVAGALPPDGDLVPLAPGVAPEALGALRALEDHLGEPIGAVVATELGAENTADAMSAAAALGVPLLDADPAGRAVPELSHSTFNLAGVPITPLALSTRHGDTAIITHVASEQRAELMVRALAAASGHSVGVADHPVRAGTLDGVLIPGTISAAGRLGRIRREVHEAGATGVEIAEAIAAADGGRVAFRGVVTSYSCGVVDGFTRGGLELRDASGARYAIDIQNEFILARLDGEVEACVPDLITVIDEAGDPVLNPDIRIGSTLTVLVLPAPEPWRSEAGLAVFGPRAFGYDVDWADTQT